MYCSITLWLGHLSDQTGIVQVNAESVWEMSDDVRLVYVRRYVYYQFRILKFIGTVGGDLCA